VRTKLRQLPKEHHLKDKAYSLSRSQVPPGWSSPGEKSEHSLTKWLCGARSDHHRRLGSGSRLTKSYSS
jgi:hypothetical protein